MQLRAAAAPHKGGGKPPSAGERDTQPGQARAHFPCHAAPVPEGDSLHKLARKLRPVLLGREVEELSLPRFAGRADGVCGQQVTAVEARGKNLLVHFADGLCLHVHLKMLGRVRLMPGHETGFRHDTVAMLKTKTHTVRVDHAPIARLLRSADVHRDLHFRNLGPDLLSPDFDEAEALSRLRRRDTVPLGEAIMDQSAVAGIGNVWKSELCFQRRLDPFKPVAAVSDDGLRGLLRLGRHQMSEHVERPRRTLPDPFEAPRHRRTTRAHIRPGQSTLHVYERAGQACYTCQTQVAMRRQGTQARSTYFCPHCQKVEARP